MLGRLHRLHQPTELRPVHLLRRRGPALYPDWDLAADMCVANLRTAAGKDPHDKGLHDLVGEPSASSDDLRRRWGAPNVRTHGSGIKQMHHHAVGDLTLASRASTCAANPTSP